MKILVCPGDFWLTNEAISTYVRSAGLVSNEMHSSTMSLGNGIPAIVCRFAEQTIKGFMLEDIGLKDWMLDNPEEGVKLTPTALAIAKYPEVAREEAAKTREFVQAASA